MCKHCNMDVLPRRSKLKLLVRKIIILYDVKGTNKNVLQNTMYNKKYVTARSENYFDMYQISICKKKKDRSKKQLQLQLQLALQTRNDKNNGKKNMNKYNNMKNILVAKDTSASTFICHKVGDTYRKRYYVYDDCDWDNNLQFYDCDEEYRNCCDVFERDFKWTGKCGFYLTGEYDQYPVNSKC